VRRVAPFLGLLAVAACSGGGARTDAATTSDVATPSDGAGTADVATPSDTASDIGATPFRVLLFSRTTSFRHDSIPTAIAALTELGAANGYVAESTEDAAAFTTANLARFRVIVFLMTTGDPLDAAGQAAFESWIGSGGGWVGVHSAADTEYDWAFYGQLVGAYFKQHPCCLLPANLHVEMANHPATAGLPSPWMRTDEWYDFQTNPRPNVTVLVTIDESSYTGGTMGPDHPLVWAHTTTGGGRAIYTAMGHTKESYAEPLFRQHLVGAIRWAAGF
jgi:type 1 glutamine amidotransferase